MFTRDPGLYSFLVASLFCFDISVTLDFLIWFGRVSSFIFWKSLARIGIDSSFQPLVELTG